MRASSCSKVGCAAPLSSSDWVVKPSILMAPATIANDMQPAHTQGEPSAPPGSWTPRRGWSTARHRPLPPWTTSAAARSLGSQLLSFFSDKDELVQAVIDHQADAIVANQRHAGIGGAEGSRPGAIWSSPRPSTSAGCRR